MSKTPWKTDKWFTSPWNFADEVAGGHDFAKQIKFHDVSLRDGEQQAGLVFTKDMKIQLAEKLAEIGIHRIEAGMPAVSPDDVAAIKEIVKRKLGPQIFAFSRCMKEDVKRAIDCGVDSIVIEIPASEHIVKYAYRWDYQRAIDLSIESTLYAKEHGLYTVFFPIDGSRSDIPTFIDLIQKVEKDGHMDALAIVDTFGGLNPHACGYLIRKIKERIKKPLEVHFHDDFGLGSANTIMALAAGAEVAHTTVSAIGERAGNAAYEDIALSLLTMYNIDTGIKHEKMYPLSKWLRRMSGLNMRQNRGIMGDDINKIESGLITDWYFNAREEAPLELSPYLYTLTGHPDVDVVIGKYSGVRSIDIYLDRIGRSCDDKDAKMEILAKVKERSLEIGGLLSVGDFENIVSKVLD
ncbi:MAG: pyruvate carboxyltransferase [Defluviitaleaceae bacterium]|nr:pyruvate carboxyltransferase [Defluviitaleaceae bacterium]